MEWVPVIDKLPYLASECVAMLYQTVQLDIQFDKPGLPSGYGKGSAVEVRLYL